MAQLHISYIMLMMMTTTTTMMMMMMTMMNNAISFAEISLNNLWIGK
jgi:hypothetical protein